MTIYKYIHCCCSTAFGSNQEHKDAEPLSNHVRLNLEEERWIVLLMTSIDQIQSRKSDENYRVDSNRRVKGCRLSDDLRPVAFSLFSFKKILFNLITLTRLLLPTMATIHLTRMVDHTAELAQHFSFQLLLDMSSYGVRA